MVRAIGFVVALAACGDKKPADRPPTASPTAKRDAGSIDAPPLPPLPACAERVTFERVPDVPGRFWQGARASNDKLVIVGHASKPTREEIHIVDLTKMSVRSIEPYVLGGLGRFPELSVLGADDRHVVLVSELEGTSTVHVLDVPRGTWAPGPPMPQAELYWGWLLEGHFVAIPMRPCGFQQPNKAERVDLGTLASFQKIDSGPSMRSRPVAELVDGKLVIWGGDSLPDAPATGDLGCKNEKLVPLSDGAVLDPKTWTWTPMPPGPPAFASVRAAVFDSYLLVYAVSESDTSLWRFDVRASSWTKLGTMPRAFAREPSFEEPHEWTRVGTSIVFVHGGVAAPAAVIVDPTEGTLREITPPPPVKPAVVTTLGDRILVLPHAPAAPTPRAYLGNPSTGAWCETPWITDAPFVDDGASPYFRTVEALADGRALLWGSGSTGAGYVASMQH